MNRLQAVPRRAHEDDRDVFDDHQLLLIAIEQLAVDMTAAGEVQAAARLRELARGNA